MTRDDLPCRRATDWISESFQVSILELELETRPAGVYNPPAVPSGAAQGAHYPAGTRGEIQAVVAAGLGRYSSSLSHWHGTSTPDSEFKFNTTRADGTYAAEYHDRSVLVLVTVQSCAY